MAEITRPIQMDPLTSFRFLIEVEGDQEISAAFSRFSGIQMEVETFQSRDGDDNRGVKEYIPVFTNYHPVTLSKGVVGNNKFLDWILSAAAGMYEGPTGENLRRNLLVTALNSSGKPAVTWVLQGAMPIAYELTAMDGSVSEVLTESVTFAIHGLERQTQTEE